MKEKQFAVLCYVFGIAITLTAQPTIQWHRTFGGSNSDQGNSIIETKDGGYLLAAQTRSTNGDGIGNNGLHDFLLIKMDAAGNTLWKKLYGGSFSELPNDLVQTTDGGYIIAGSTGSGDGDVIGYHEGSFDAWVVKLDSMGNMEWNRAYGGSDWEHAYSIEQTSDGGYVFAGVAASTDGDVTDIYGGWDSWIVKIDAAGNIVWQQTLGGTYEDFANSVLEADDGGYVIAGITWSYDGDVTYNNGNTDCWIVKLSSTGSIEWERSFGGLGADDARKIIKTQEGGYAFIGLVSSHNSGDVTGHFDSDDYWLVNLTDTGELLWQKCLGGTTEDNGASLIQTPDGGFVLFGDTNSSDGLISNPLGGSDFWLVKTDNTGNLLWEKSYGGAMGDNGINFSTTSDNGLILTGYTWSTNGDLAGITNKGLGDIWVVKLGSEILAAPDVHTLPLALFPNPTTDVVSINLPPESQAVSIQIFNTVGQLVSDQPPVSTGQINVASLPAGLYQLLITDQKGLPYRASFCKAK
jgi:Secretion system C-terminal sorting domain